MGNKRKLAIRYLLSVGIDGRGESDATVYQWMSFAGRVWNGRQWIGGVRNG